MGGNDKKKTTFKHVLNENTALDNLLVDYELHIIGSDKMNHVNRADELVTVVAMKTVYSRDFTILGDLQVLRNAYISFPSLFT